MKKIVLCFIISLILPAFALAGFTIRKGGDIKIVFNDHEEQVVNTAIEMFKKDFNAVFNASLITASKDGEIFVGTIGLQSLAESMVHEDDLEKLSELEEAFLLKLVDSKLVVLGSDKRGTAYGILELSRMIGVSPWVWWADSPVEKKESLTLRGDFESFQYPSVARRGIFLNDEDWGLTPWSYLTHEPSEIEGQIGPKTYARIFELLLRLRANTIWPAMHKCTVAFYQIPGNKEMADKYGIFVGTSHCEPMVCNANFEWEIRGEGHYDYVNNRESVLKFWEERVSQLANSDNIYTLGIRGEHDGRMQGAETLQEQKDAIFNIFKDQRELIAKHVNPNVEEVSQVFIPYKEVLDVYNMGLDVPEDVTLMWTDDNYGYIRHFPDSIERARKGGNGVYYHVSYWGRPHDYLWIATTSPALVYHQMKMAWDKGSREMWILNVGDIKPAEYLTELFMDMAWDIDAIKGNIQGIDQHLFNWLSREFGDDMADKLLLLMTEYYRLAYIRKPEFMGNTRTEEKDPAYKIVSDLPWSEHYIKNRIKEYESIADKIVSLSSEIPDNEKDAWFQLIEYPVRGAAEMNRKILYGQLARHGLAEWENSDAAYDTIALLTAKYNSLNNGKWNRIMDFKPRRLAVYDKVERRIAEKPLVDEKKPLYLFNGNEYSSYQGKQPLENGLGYNRGAISLQKWSSVVFEFENSDADSVVAEVALAPFHPVEGNQIRYSISLNDETEQVVDYHTEGRSEEWKQNVLRNQAIRLTSHKIIKPGIQQICIKALDEGVIIDQVKIR
ncbi:MAG: glycosyl hydrolase 115 family protein [Prolixibacteraceae bacterium]|nr:glycosyl hydrolase 115 family protein [Prolixibacteraceae bacterium]